MCKILMATSGTLILENLWWSRRELFSILSNPSSKTLAVPPWSTSDHSGHYGNRILKRGILTAIDSLNAITNVQIISACQRLFRKLSSPANKNLYGQKTLLHRRYRVNKSRERITLLKQRRSITRDVSSSL
jgi:hypothetical protein